MPTQNFFALCDTDQGLQTRHIPLVSDVQRRMAQLFLEQEDDFRRGVSSEEEFTGDWNPDDDELLTVDLSSTASLLKNTLSESALAIPTLDAATFIDYGVKAIFTGTGSTATRKVLVQRFTAQQVLSRKFSLFLKDSSFKELSEPAFSLDTKLTCIIEGGKVKFKSFYIANSILDLSTAYTEATNEDITAFSQHEKIHISDVSAFQTAADKTIRKLVHKVSGSGILDNFSSEQIKRKATTLGVTLAISNGKLVLPTNKQEIKKFLRFLDDSLYEGPMTGNRYMTNSKKPVS